MSARDVDEVLEQLAAVRVSLELLELQVDELERDVREGVNAMTADPGGT